MKQPSKTQAGDKADKTTGSDGSTPAAKTPAAPGVISSTETGTGKPAQAGQPGKVTPAESTLVGQADKGLPPAQPKAGTTPADKAAVSDATLAGKAADDKPAAKDAAAAAGPFGTGKAQGQAALGASTSATGSGPSQEARAKDAAASGSTTAAARSGSGSSTASGTPAAKSAAPVRKTGFWPVALGGVVAAGLGAAATIYALPHLPPEWRPAAPQAAATDDGALQQAAEEAARRVVAEELSARPAEADDAATAEMSERLAALEQRLDAPATEGDAPGAGAEQLAALQQRLDEQQAQLEELAARPAFDPQAAADAQSQIEAAASEAEQRLEAARAEAQELQDAAAESTRRAEAVAAIASLQSALDRGVTPDEARQTLEGAGLDTPEALMADVPSLTSLQADFPEAARAALRAALRDSSASGQGNLVTNFLRAQTGARSVEARDGDDPDAVLSRAGAQVEAGRIDQALTEIEALPEPAGAAPAMADWLSRATAYTQAQAALSDLSSGTN